MLDLMPLELMLGINTAFNPVNHSEMLLHRNGILCSVGYLGDQKNGLNGATYGDSIHTPNRNAYD